MFYDANIYQKYFDMIYLDVKIISNINRSIFEKNIPLPKKNDDMVDITDSEKNHKQRITDLSKAIKILDKSGINPSCRNLADYLNWSKTTVNKYMHIVPKYLVQQNSEVISSVSYSQDQIIYSILKLHNNSNPIELDVTYSQGQFYNQSLKYPIQQPRIKMDVNPQYDDVIEISPLKPLNIDDNSISSIMIDLPFIVAPPSKIDKNKTNIIQKRFDAYYPRSEMFKSYHHYIQEAYRVLKKNGIMIIKTQGTVSGGINLFTPEFVWMVCYQMGWYCLDQFFLIAKNRVKSGKVKQQQHARKFSSTFYCFKKCSRKIDYFDW